MKLICDLIARCSHAVPTLSTPPGSKPALLVLLGAMALTSAQTSTQAAEVFTPGQLRAERFNGATIAQVKAGTATVSHLEYATALQFPDVDPAADNYTRRVTGFFIPPTTGNYVFFLSSDDQSELWLSTDASPANKRLIAQETAWSAVLSWTVSAGGSNLDLKRSDRFSPAGSTNRPFASGIPLVGGTRYYMEAYQVEGTGGDNLAATFKLLADADPENSTDSALTGPVIGMNVPDTLTLLGQPLNRRVAPGATVTFSTVAEPPTATFQWFRNGAPIAGETQSSFTTAPLTSTDNGAIFHVVATDGARSVTSSNAVVTVGTLVPVANSLFRELWNDDALTRPEVEDPGFATPPDVSDTLPVFETPTNISDNYVQRVSGLFIPAVSGNYVFFIAADDQGDLFLSTDSNPANKRLIAQETGWSGVRNWNGVGGAGGGLDATQSIAQKRSDGFRVDPLDTTTPPPFTNGIALVAGTSYYIEAVQEEGGGGDNMAVTFKLTSEPNPANGSAPRIDSTLLGTYSLAKALNGATINITRQPATTNGLQNRTVTLSFAAATGYQGDASGVGPAATYVWETAPAGSSTFTRIPGATGTSYTTPALALTESGRQYRVVIKASDATTTSAAATVNVTPDTAAPRPVTVAGVNAGRNVVTLSFNEALGALTATNGANYSFGPGNILGSSVALANGTNLTITTASPLTPNVENTLTITGVQDLAGNPVAGSTTIKFTFNPVTYDANIRFDQPVAYFRFEETAGSVSTNSGTSGINGAYFEGDEAAPGEGGVAREPGNVPGPRPTDFAGFAANNLAANFDGVDDWVDARAQYLQGRSAFTLEYWVRPHRTNDIGEVGPGRVALVGQNDAIEYGFITPTTIQIWTAGGGSLDTTYATNGVPLKDDEWHHVATIATGAAIQNYFDGVLVGTGGTATANYGSSTYFVHIGGAGGFDATGNWFTGQLDEVAIFDKAISADRVAAHFRAGKEGGVITVSGAVTPADPSGGGGPTLTTSKTGTTMTISWSPAGGTLQSTPTLSNPNWTAVGTENPATIQITGNARFFRVLR